MFPNLRLMVVAVLASILGISCALGLFAEFRVSHDSFLRESNASTPLQLGSGDAAAPGRVVNTAAPFEFRFQAPPPPPLSKPLVVLKRQIALRSFKRCSLPMRLRQSLSRRQIPRPLRTPLRRRQILPPLRTPLQRRRMLWPNPRPRRIPPIMRPRRRVPPRPAQLPPQTVSRKLRRTADRMPNPAREVIWRHELRPSHHLMNPRRNPKSHRQARRQ